MCVVRAQGVERVEHDVLVVSVDRLAHVLRVAARMDGEVIAAEASTQRDANAIVASITTP